MAKLPKVWHISFGEMTTNPDGERTLEVFVGMTRWAVVRLAYQHYGIAAALRIAFMPLDTAKRLS